MRKPRSNGAKLLAVLVLALGGFALATVITGVGFATDTPSSSSSSSTTDTTTTTPPTTSTTPPPTTTTPPPGQGCTPGFWKQDQHFDSWPVPTSTTLAGAGFTNTGHSASTTLLAALSFQGGNTVQDAKDILLRAAAAAYLNSFAVNYPLTTAEVVSQVNAALASGNRATILALATTLDNNNNLGCPF
ncbi:MAG TPA: hypothetical protein VIZ44_07185 [Gaiellaceae bacterium]|jgi:hypothetical protein